MRALAFALILLLAAAALASSNRERPLIAEAHASGAWDFNNAEAPRNWPKEHRMFAPCPWTPWALPKKQDEVQV